jgi:thioredoxin-related protein
VVPTIQDRCRYHHRLSLHLPRNQTLREAMHSNLMMVRLYTEWGKSQDTQEMRKTFIDHVINFFT